MKKYIYFLIFIFSSISLFVNASILNENDFNAKHYELLFKNQSILSCGSGDKLEVYSSLDVQIILAISNSLSSQQISFETDWQSFRPPPLTSVNFNENQFSTLPGDIKRILFLCLTWNESERLKLFVIPDAALDNIATRLQQERPWKNLDAGLVKKADNLSKATLKQFVYIVLRANVFESTRGDLLNNKSLWFVSWDWLTPNSGIYQ